MKKVVFRIVFYLFWLLVLFGTKKFVYILKDASVLKYDVNGNEIYSCPGKGSNEFYRKYNDKNQLIELKSVFGGKDQYYIYYEYDGDLLRKQIFKNGDLPAPVAEEHEILYEYNQQGLISKTINSVEGETLYQYDDKSNLVTKISPNNKTINYEYDKNGKCIKEESSDGSIIEREYDEKGRSLRTSYTNHPVQGNHIERWEYFDDDPKILRKYYSEGESGTNYMTFDKNGEYIETGWIRAGEILKTKYKKITLYTHWKNGKIKSKRVFTLYRS